MASNVINLREVRKERARAEKERKAAENRARFGRTKADRKQEAASDELARRRHEALKRQTGEGADKVDEPAKTAPGADRERQED